MIKFVGLAGAVLLWGCSAPLSIEAEPLDADESKVVEDETDTIEEVPDETGMPPGTGGGDPGMPPDDGNGEECACNTDDVSHRSGSRLKVMYIEGDDGSRISGGMWDTELETQCVVLVPGLVPGGTAYCIPVGEVSNPDYPVDGLVAFSVTTVNE